MRKIGITIIALSSISGAVALEQGPMSRPTFDVQELAADLARRPTNLTSRRGRPGNICYIGPCVMDLQEICYFDSEGACSDGGCGLESTFTCAGAGPLPDPPT
jgi:hypothetical protein